MLCVERDEPGAGASGVAAGMLAPVTEADFGEEDLLALNLESRELWPGFAAELEELHRHAHRLRRDRARWWWPPTATTPRSCAACTSFQRELGLDSEWLGAARGARAGAGALAAHRRRDPRAAGRPGGPAPRWWRPWRTRCAAAGGELRDRRRGRGPDHGRGAVTGVRAADGPVAARRPCWWPRARGAPGRAGHRGRRPAGAAGEGPAAGAARARRRASRRRTRMVRTPRCYVRHPRGRARGGRRDHGGAGLRHGGDRRRRVPPARGRVRGAARGRPSWSWCARAPGCGPPRPTTAR